MIIKKYIVIFITIFASLLSEAKIYASEPEELSLYALSAVLYDAGSERVLYGKDENKVMAMASTTKIMTLIIALEYGNLSDAVTISKYASTQPDVQMDVVVGEQYCLNDLLYAMMMQSYNDVAVAIAEYVADKYSDGAQDATKVINRSTTESKEKIAVFTGLMNEKAKELGCVNTNFITVNGLDAENESGKHSTTALEMAKIAAYAISLAKTEEICTTRQYSLSEINGKRNASFGNTDRFLDMMDGAIGMKTGFTGDAGYCFVGAVKRDGRTLISVVFGCGWPPNKNYKWVDTKALMNYGIDNFFFKKLFVPQENYKKIKVNNGEKKEVDTYIPFSLDMFIAEHEKVEIVYRLPDFVEAPVVNNQEVGRVLVYIDGGLHTSFSILTKEKVKEKDYFWYLKNLFKNLIF